MREAAVGPVAQVVEIEHGRRRGGRRRRLRRRGARRCRRCAAVAPIAARRAASTSVDGEHRLRRRRCRRRSRRQRRSPRRAVRSRARDATDPLGERLDPLGAMRLATEELGATGAVQGDGDALAHRAGADDEHPLARRGRRRRSVTISTAAWLTEAVPRPMPVSVRARLPASMRVAEQQVERRPGGTLVLGESPTPSRTWPRISLSPSTAESSPAATSKRCATAASSCWL